MDIKGISLVVFEPSMIGATQEKLHVDLFTRAQTPLNNLIGSILKEGQGQSLWGGGESSRY